MDNTRQITIISSQQYLDDSIVQSKRDSGDYRVALGKVIEVDGELYRVVVDGHHALAAAKADGVAPKYVDSTASDRERVSDIDDYLAINWIDCDWYDIETGLPVWQ